MKQGVLLIMCLLLFSCSKMSDKELMLEGKNSINQEKYQEAVNSFKELIDEYPNSELAKDAIFEIGKLYHGKALKNVPEKESLETGIKYYRQLVDEYPDSKEAPKALFMIAYLQANELNQVAEAKKNYQKFLQLYPDNEMAPSAKVELDNAGIEPEKFLKKQPEFEE